MNEEEPSALKGIISGIQPYVGAISYVGSLILLLGVFRQMIYYQYFGISIVPFLDLSEILMSFFDMIWLFVAFVLLSCFDNNKPGQVISAIKKEVRFFSTGI